MMDNFSEQLVKRQRTSSDNVKRTVVIFGGIAVTLLLLAVSVAFLGSLISIRISACGCGGVHYCDHNSEP